MSLSSVKLPTLAEIQAERSRRQVRDSFPIWLKKASPKMHWDWPHIKFICDALSKNMRSNGKKKLMIFLPPRHGKSELVTIRYSTWFLEHNPELRVIIGAYNQMLANKFSRKVRRIAEERFSISNERSAVEDWETNQGGGLRAVGVGAGITGQGGDIIIIDDPVKNREEAQSTAYREKVWTWYTDDLYTRLEPGGMLVLIMTRWHEDDLAGRILASDDAPNWDVISLPAIAEPGDALGRTEGEALCPERYDVPALMKIKSIMKSSFDALYQQRPSAMEGVIFKREWWMWYTAQPHFHGIVQSWDTGFKAREDNDYSCCITAGVSATGIYLLDRWMEKVEYPELLKTVDALAHKWRPFNILIEDKASGQSLIQDMKRKTRWAITPVQVDKDKRVRASLASPLVESSRVYLPEGLPWVQDYVDSMATFPNAAHDDDVDASTLLLNYLSTSFSLGSGEISLGSERATAAQSW